LVEESRIVENKELDGYKEYWDRMPDSAPDEYSRPAGTPYKAEVDATTFKAVKTSKNGIRRRGDPSGSGGTDGQVEPKELLDFED